MVLIKFLAFIILLYGAAGLVLSFITIPGREKDENGRETGGTTKRKIVLPLHKFALGLGVFAFFITSIIVRIGAQDAGVMVTPGGVDENELHTGWHIVMPWNTIYIMDKTVWVYTCANAASEGAKPDADAIWAPT